MTLRPEHIRSLERAAHLVEQFADALPESDLRLVVDDLREIIGQPVVVFGGRDQSVHCAVCRGDDGVYYGCEFCPSTAYTPYAERPYAVGGNVPDGYHSWSPNEHDWRL